MRSVLFLRPLSIHFGFRITHGILRIEMTQIELRRTNTKVDTAGKQPNMLQ